VKLAIKRKHGLEPVSELTTNRLSVYLRCQRARRRRRKTVSSQCWPSVPSQRRPIEDLAYFGEFGVRGVGYYVKDLKRHLRQILGLDRKVRVAIMGAGNLGLALADYPGFRQEGFEIVALFDNVSSKVGQRSRGGVPILDVKDLKRCLAREGRHRGHRVPALQQVVNPSSRQRHGCSTSPGTLSVPPVKLSVDLTVSPACRSTKGKAGDR
jgi:redox-sensing transcriptional repressor